MSDQKKTNRATLRKAKGLLKSLVTECGQEFGIGFPVEIRHQEGDIYAVLTVFRAGYTVASSAPSRK